jgi:hypothetical protein
MELSDQMEYQIIKLKAKDTANGYAGITKVKADQCVESMGALWRYFALLAEVVEKAKEIDKKNSFLNNTEDEVRELLETATIVIETEPIAISERNLIGSKNSERKATPGELLKYMQDCFESVCETVNEISKAAETVDTRLSTIKNEISELKFTAKRLGLNNTPEFDFDKVTEAERDPLKGLIELDKLIYSIEKYRASIETLKREYNRIFETLKRISGMLSELNELAEKSKDAIANSQKIFGYKFSTKPVASEDVLKSLQEWLIVLEGRLAEGHLNAVKIGASRLEQECSLKLKVEKENYYENSKDFNEWLDLKGHFKALRAKAEALKAKGLVLGDSLNEQIENTEAALYANIVDLNICRQLVRKFELSLKR